MFRKEVTKKDRPSQSTIRKIVNKFGETGLVEYRQVPGRPINARTEENIAAVAASVGKDPSISVQNLARQLRLSTSTTWRILRNDLHLRSFKPTNVQKLRPLDRQRRVRFANRILKIRQRDHQK